MIIAICILLGVLLAASMIYIYVKKREVRNLSLALLAIVNTDTNAKLTTATKCKDTAAFVNAINELLQQRHDIILATTRQESNLKRAITNISHDLRTPLTAAKGYLQMLESPSLDSGTRTKYLQVAQERLATQTALMDSLFEFAKVMEGREMPVAEHVNLCDMLRDVLSANYAHFAENGIDVDVNIPDTLVSCHCNRNAAERIFQNLIKNTYTHGKEYARFTINDGVVEIANKAENIHEIDTSQLFDRFYTADAARTNNSTGLGLAIVKELATQMGWKVEAETVDELVLIQVAFDF